MYIVDKLAAYTSHYKKEMDNRAAWIAHNFSFGSTEIMRMDEVQLSYWMDRSQYINKEIERDRALRGRG